MTDLQILETGENRIDEELLACFKAVQPSLGFKTAGSERLFFAALDLAMEECPQKALEPFIAFEIGTATGLTTRALQNHLEHSFAERGAHRPYNDSIWKVISCDLPDGWSLNIDQLKRNLPGGSFIDATGSLELFPPNHATVCLSASERVLASPAVPHINFAFIDGCHCYQCVLKDFVNVNEKLVENGMIVFHDTGRSIQSAGLSKHGLNMIYTRHAVEDIMRNWESSYQLLANLESDSNQNGMIIVRKR